MASISVVHHDDPLLEFGTGEASTPKEGLATGGPYSLRLGGGHRETLRLSVIGTPSTIAETHRLLDRLEAGVSSESNNLALFPDFPGFESVFRCRLHRGQDHVIGEPELKRVLALHPREAFTQAVDMWAGAVDVLAERELRPDIVLVAQPQALLEKCRRIDQPLPARLAQAAREQERMRQAGQTSLFDLGAGETIEEAADPAPEDLLFRDFRRALKARAMTTRLPIQLLTRHAWADRADNEDPATRAWNLSVAMFYKAGGIPWRAKPRTEETCFVGISFHHLKTSKRHVVYSSLAQAFSSDGEGFALRGASMPWDERMRRSPHLTGAKANRLLSDVLEAYRERAGRNPLRLVVHKTSVFTPEEREGIEDALRAVPRVQLMTLRSGDFRLVRQGLYPPHRGSACQVGNARFLFTVGYMPQVLTYPGPHVPVPLEILGCEEDFDGTVSDLLALTKMNWNSAKSWAALPISLSFARMVGGVMAELPKGQSPHPSFRFYM